MNHAILSVWGLSCVTVCPPSSHSDESPSLPPSLSPVRLHPSLPRSLSFPPALSLSLNPPTAHTFVLWRGSHLSNISKPAVANQRLGLCGSSRQETGEHHTLCNEHFTIFPPPLPPSPPTLPLPPHGSSLRTSGPQVIVTNLSVLIMAGLLQLQIVRKTYQAMLLFALPSTFHSLCVHCLSCRLCA